MPDRDDLHADLVSLGNKFDRARRLVLESKQDLRRRGMPSPDLADAVALCFSEPEGSISDCETVLGKARFTGGQ